MQLKVVIALSCAATLAACAGTPLQAIKNEVDARLTYTPYAARDYREVTGQGGGNCAAFAATYRAQAARRGIAGQIKTCVLQNGDGHAFFVASSGEALDVRLPQVAAVADLGCIRGSLRTAATTALASAGR